MTGEFRKNNLCKMEMIVLKASQKVQAALTVVSWIFNLRGMVSDSPEQKTNTIPAIKTNE